MLPLRHEVSVRLVLVDLIALDKEGRSDASLTKDDFEVFEDGKKIVLRSAELIRRRISTPAGSPPEPVSGAPVPAGDSRFFVVVDSINTIKRFLDKDRARIVERLASLTQIGQEIMVLEMTEDGQVKVLQPLTKDRALIAKAVDAASGSIWVEKAGDTLAIPKILQGQHEAGAYGPPIGGNKFEQTNRDIYELETRNRFEKTINSLLVVLNMIKDNPGKKSLLFISGGIPSVSFGGFMSGQGGPIEDTTVIQTQVAAAKILDPFKSLKKMGFRSGQEILEDLAQFANSNNISFYALDPDNYLRYVLGDMAYDNYARASYGVGGQGAGLAFRQDEMGEIKKVELSKLKSLCGDTGGVSFLGGNKFEEFQKVVERDLSSGYELSYAPSRTQPDGKYHKIEVRTKKPGRDLRFRQGYMDYNDAQKESLVFAAAAYNPSLFKDIPFEARIIPFVQGPTKYSLWVQTALPLKKLTADNIAPEKPVVLKLKILVDIVGRDRGLLSEVAVPLVLSPSFFRKNEAAEFIGFGCSSQELDLGQEQYRVTLALYNESLGQVGALERLVSVPAPRNARECRVVNSVLGNLSQAPASSSLSYAVSSKDGALDLPGYKFYPLAVNSLDHLKIAAAFFQVFAPDSSVALQAEFSLEQDGALVSPLSSRPVQAAWNKKGFLWNIVSAFALGDFAPGDYQLKVRMKDASGAVRAETAIPVKLT
jgi:VWFA-related protein